MCLLTLIAPMSHKMGQNFKTRDLDLWTSMKTFSQQDDFSNVMGQSRHWELSAYMICYLDMTLWKSRI